MPSLIFPYQVKIPDTHNLKEKRFASGPSYSYAVIRKNRVTEGLGRKKNVLNLLRTGIRERRSQEKESCPARAHTGNLPLSRTDLLTAS